MSNLIWRALYDLPFCCCDRIPDKKYFEEGRVYSGPDLKGCSLAWRELHERELEGVTFHLHSGSRGRKQEVGPDSKKSHDLDLGTLFLYPDTTFPNSWRLTVQTHESIVGGLGLPPQITRGIMF